MFWSRCARPKVPVRVLNAGPAAALPACMPLDWDAAADVALQSTRKQGGRSSDVRREVALSSTLWHQPISAPGSFSSSNEGRPLAAMVVVMNLCFLTNMHSYRSIGCLLVVCIKVVSLVLLQGFGSLFLLLWTGVYV